MDKKIANEPADPSRRAVLGNSAKVMAAAAGAGLLTACGRSESPTAKPAGEAKGASAHVGPG